MRKNILVVVSLIACSALVSSHSNVKVVEDDTGSTEKMKAYSAPELAFIKIENQYSAALNDAVVPVVPHSPTVHTSFIPAVADGHTPLPLAMVRGPTKEVKNLLPFSRAKPV